MNRLPIVAAIGGFLIGVLLISMAAICPPLQAASAGKTRTYYIAAEEATWDYAPAGRDVVMGMDFDDDATVFVGRSADRIGSKYKKAIFVEYTDATFKERKPRPAAWQHLGHPGADHSRSGRRQDPRGLSQQGIAAVFDPSAWRVLYQGQ
jgi:hypothetical protein